MNILLRILVILTLVLNGVAFWFTYALYGKRELLKDRNDRFREFTVEIAKTLEADQPATTEEDEATLAAKTTRDDDEISLDTADMAPEELRRVNFWTDGEGYHIEYEATPEFYAVPNVADLDEIYILDAEKKAKLDARGLPVTAGSPMDLALKEIVAKSEAQRDHYALVRGQLTALREEYEATIPVLNAAKAEARQHLKTIQARDNTISGLEADKANLEGQVADRDQQIATLEEEKQTLQNDLDAITEERDTLADAVENLKKTLEMFAQGGQGANTSANGIAAIANVSAGIKGTIARVDNEYNFAIVKLTPESLTELIGEAGDRPLPEVEFYVCRPGKQSDVIAKVKLRTLVKDQSAIVCDIPADWKQADVQLGDEVFYLD
ncbi:MAG TPA: hypothetical protein IAC79_04030 [Candidatus Spyradenecus faecavium]|uniref:Uncharacterized protein n=1 Tax=Candidatus Spyradenecus faecavium TaxID=2840947 RepID=A0A9D1NNI6_9BACT|nr:hypothetical protein [Candidatus Spyradenecus faecavium]